MIKLVDTIVKGFTKTVQQLEAAVQSNQAASGKAFSRAAAATTAAENYAAEAQRAQKLADNISKLLEV